MSEPGIGSPGRRRNSGRKGDSRELAILDAAEALLERDGYDRMTVEGIAQGAGITRGALYFYFGSKQEVLTALVARTMTSVVSAADLAATRTDDVPTILETALRSTESSWRDHGRVMRAAVELGPLIPEIGALWKSTVDTYIAAISEVLLRAGTPPGDGPASARSLAEALCWMTERNFYWSHVATQGERLGNVTDVCLTVWLAALPAPGEIAEWADLSRTTDFPDGHQIG